MLPSPSIAPGTLDEYRLGQQINRNPEHQVRIASGPHGSCILKFVPLLENRYVRRVLASEQAGAQVQRELYRRHHGPPIPQVYTTGWDDGCWFVAMQLVDGVPLSEDMLPPAEALHLVAGLARCLAEWHEGADSPPVLLGDIKPSNLMRDTGGRLWIVDFGAARTATRGFAPDVVRSLAYCSPERLARRVVSPASDRWALLVTLYELLAGYRPFDLELGFAEPPPIPEIDPAWNLFLRRGLALDPAGRHTSTHALAADLEALAGTMARSGSCHPAG